MIAKGMGKAAAKGKGKRKGKEQESPKESDKSDASGTSPENVREKIVKRLQKLTGRDDLVCPETPLTRKETKDYTKGDKGVEKKGKGHGKLAIENGSTDTPRAKEQKVAKDPKKSPTTAKKKKTGKSLDKSNKHTAAKSKAKAKASQGKRKKPEGHEDLEDAAPHEDEEQQEEQEEEQLDEGPEEEGQEEKQVEVTQDDVAKVPKKVGFLHDIWTYFIIGMAKGDVSMYCFKFILPVYT